MLYHVRDVKEGGSGARKSVRGCYAVCAVLDGHVVAREGHHFASVGHMEVVEGGLSEVCGYGGRCRGMAKGDILEC